MDKATPMGKASLVDSLLRCIQYEIGMGSPADPLAHDISSVDVDHECDIGEVGYPKPVGRRRVKLSVYLIEPAFFC